MIHFRKLLAKTFLVACGPQKWETHPPAEKMWKREQDNQQGQGYVMTASEVQKQIIIGNMSHNSDS